MGTNFYTTNEPCPTCGRGDEQIHIGKSSMGWRFAFQYNGGRYYKTFAEFKTWLADKKIKDEYGRDVTLKEFWEMVERKQKVDEPAHDRRDEINLDGYIFVDHEFS